jgi:thioesterase domain-containing protein
MNSDIPPIDNIEEIAEMYIAEIKEKGFTGPFSLLGNSIGGQIAFEMAKQLLAKGEEVSFLGMIDTIASIKAEKNKGLMNQLLYFVKKLLFEIQFFFDDPIYYFKYRSKYLKEKVNEYGESSEDKDLSSLKTRIKKVEDMNMIAWEKYTHEPIDADITLFLAKKKTFYVDDFKTFGWAPYVNKVDVLYMPGEHADMLKAPNGIEFSRALQNILNSSNL